MRIRAERKMLEALWEGRPDDPGRRYVVRPISKEVAEKVDPTGETLFMERVPGKLLSDILKEQGSLAWEEALWMIRQLAEGLLFVHKQWIVHRDVKPSNVILAEDELGIMTAKRIDFGIAGPPVENDDKIVGTPAYMAPERFRGNDRVDEQTDIFSLGVLFYQMLAGRQYHPFAPEGVDGIEGVELGQLIRWILHNPVKKLPFPVPRGVEQILEKMLAKDVGERYFDCIELIEQIDTVLFDEGSRS